MRTLRDRTNSPADLPIPHPTDPHEILVQRQEERGGEEGSTGAGEGMQKWRLHFVMEVE